MWDRPRAWLELMSIAVEGHCSSVRSVLPSERATLVRQARVGDRAKSAGYSENSRPSPCWTSWIRPQMPIFAVGC